MPVSIKYLETYQKMAKITVKTEIIKESLRYVFKMDNIHFMYYINKSCSA